jgi:hypothetical protein
METTELPRTETLTAEWLLEHFGEGTRIDPVLTKEQAEEAVNILRNGRDSRPGPDPFQEQALRYLNDVLDFHGIEVIRTSGHHGYWGDVRYLFMNSGHSTALELFYNVRTGEWIAGCFMDLHAEDAKLHESR